MMEITTANMEDTNKTREEPEKVRGKPRTPADQPSLLQDILALLIKIFAILTALGLLFTFLFGIVSVRDMSMKPAVQDGDVAIFYRLKKEYVASDVLALKYEGQIQVRRVVAVAGDTVDITEGGLIINGSLIADSTRQELLLYEDGASFPLTVGEGQVFVLGDYRQGTIDSRMYGPVDTKDTLGKVIALIRQRNI